jgi:Na+/H+-dicarboxylate symporter
MSKLLAIVTGLKAILNTASVALARGDMLPVILISILFNLAQLGAKPVGEALPGDTIVVSRSHDEGR